MLIIMSVALCCTALSAEESIEQKAGALITKQDLSQLIQMYEQAIRTKADAERTELSKTIISNFKRDDVSQIMKAELLTLLVRFSGAESVDFFATLLSNDDPLFRSRAILGLQRNASESAALLLRKVLANATEPEKRAEMIHALSLREDRSSLPEFIKYAKDADDTVRTAALFAIARMSDDPVNALFKAGIKQGSVRAKRETINAYLLHADRLAKAGKKTESLAIYHELVSEDGWVKADALMGMALVGGEAELTTILANIKDEKPCIINITDKLFTHIPKSGPVITAVRENMKTADPSLKVRLLEVLGQYADPAGLDPILEATKNTNQTVCTVAVCVLGRFDDKRAADALIATLVAGKETDSAVMAIGISPQNSVIMEGLISALPDASGHVRVSIVRALGSGQANKVVPILLKVIEDNDAMVRSEVFNAMRKIGDPSVYPGLVDRLSMESDQKVQLTAVNALAALGTSIKEPAQRTAPVLARLASGNSPGRPALLQLLSHVCCESSQEQGLKFVREDLNSKDENLRRAAILAMSEWRDPKPVLDPLLQVTKQAPESVFGVLALRAYSKQIGALIDKYQTDIKEKRITVEDVQKEIIKHCTEGMAVAVKPPEIMGFLSHLGKQYHPDALKAVTVWLDNQNVKREAIQAVLSIAAKLYKSHANVVKPALDKIKTVSDDKQFHSQADQLLKTMEKKK